MIRLAVSPVLIALGAALTAHFLAINWVDWSACFEDASRTSYRDFWNSLMSHWGLSALTLGAPYLSFLIVAVFLRASERLVWQWIGIGITTAFLATLLIGVSSGTTCPDEGRIAEFDGPELLLMVLGGGVGFAVCLVVTYIGTVRHARRNAS